MKRILIIAVVIGAPALLWRATAVRTTVPETSTTLLSSRQCGNYIFEYQSSHGDQAIGGTQIGGHLNLHGTLRLCNYGANETGQQQLGLNFVTLDTAVLFMLGRNVLDQAAATDTLLGHEMLATIDKTGEMLRLGTTVDAPALFRHIARAILLELQFSSASGTQSQWVRMERTPRGLAPTTFAVKVQDGHTVIDKWRDTYTRLDSLSTAGTAAAPHNILAEGLFQFSFDSNQALDSLRGKETVLAEDAGGEPQLTLFVHIDLKRFGMPLTARRPNDTITDFRPAATLQPSPDAQARALRLQVGELQETDILTQIREVGLGGIIPNQDEWFWRATGLLQLKPEFATELAALFNRPQTGSEGRGLILSLLVSAGHPMAQRALVTALDSDTARADPQYGLLLQRASLLRKPEPEVVEFFHDRVAKETGEIEKAATLALGSVAGARLRMDQDPQALAAHNAIRLRLSQAGSAEDQAILLRSLGNVGSADDVEVIGDFAKSDHEEVRRAAAKSLRKLDDTTSEDILFELLNDDAARVQGAAIAALGGRTIPANRLEDIDALVVANRLNDTNADQLVNLLVHRYAADPRSKEIFRHILANDPKRSELAARLRVLLE